MIRCDTIQYTYKYDTIHYNTIPHHATPHHTIHTPIHLLILWLKAQRVRFCSAKDQKSSWHHVGASTNLTVK
jgi:hypothetical protein